MDRGASDGTYLGIRVVVVILEGSRTGSEIRRKKKYRKKKERSGRGRRQACTVSFFGRDAEFADGIADVRVRLEQARAGGSVRPPARYYTLVLFISAVLFF